jgi:hypothetical protein
MRLPDWSKRGLYPIFPTLSDLYAKLSAHPHTTSKEPYKKVLAEQVDALCHGAKGLLLDTAHSTPLPQLLSHPTVLEMTSIINQAEKTFLLGLLLIRLYEYRRLHTSGSDTLPHLLVLEETHLLFGNQIEPTQQAQVKALFCTLFAELQTYGQGVIFTEQFPVKLPIDLLKQATKMVIHRLVAKDDLSRIEQATTMTAEQLRQISMLKPDEVLIHNAGSHEISHRQLKDEQAILLPLDDETLRSLSPSLLYPYAAQCDN